MAAMETILQEAMARRGLVGLSLATLRQGALHEVHALGRRGSHDPMAVDVHTVFEAASLTKPLVASIALQLVQEGRFDLDQPLQAVCGAYVPDDPRAAAITPRHVLTHTSGLSNIVREEAPLKTHFAPGERFSYGSSAFAWLQRAMEKVCGSSLQQLAVDRVFQPLGMVDSSLQWSARFEGNHAQGHDWDGQPVSKRRLEQAQASWSLLTTAADYARFVQAVLAACGLTAAMHAQWFEPAVHPRQGGDAEDLAGAHPPALDMGWGLGWGLEPQQRCFFHWGHSPGFRAWVLAHRDTGDGVVWFANAARGLRIVHDVLPLAVPGPHPSVQWMQIGQ